MRDYVAHVILQNDITNANAIKFQRQNCISKYVLLLVIMFLLAFRSHLFCCLLLLFFITIIRSHIPITMNYACLLTSNIQTVKCAPFGNQ